MNYFVFLNVDSCFWTAWLVFDMSHHTEKHMGGIEPNQQYIVLGLLSVTECALLATVTLWEDCSFVILKNISFKTDSQTNPNFMLGIQYHTSPALSRNKKEYVLFGTVSTGQWCYFLLFYWQLSFTTWDEASFPVVGAPAWIPFLGM